MLDKVRKTVKEYKMIGEGEAVLCCLSGGADSVSLLLCLIELGYEVRAFHLNHQLRGVESERDENFCRSLCERLGVPLTVERADVSAYCKERGVSVEAGARRLRYELFAKQPVDRIATAHTLSDSLETALFNLARGTAAKGLCGIPPVRGKIIRPLIRCTRAEVEAFLSERGESFVTDSSNLSDDYSRNRIRHHAVPALKKVCASAELCFGRLSDSLRADDDYLCSLSEQLLEKAKTKGGYSVNVLKDAPMPLLTRAAASLLKAGELEVDHQAVTDTVSVMRGESRRLCLSGKVYALSAGGVFRISQLSGELAPEPLQLNENETVSYCGAEAEVVICNIEDVNCKVNEMFTYSLADYGKIKDGFLLRTRAASDSVKLVGRDTKTVKKLFSESVPVEERSKRLILCDSEGIIMIEGLGTAQRCAVDDNTKQVALFLVRRPS